MKARFEKAVSRILSAAPQRAGRESFVLAAYTRDPDSRTSPETSSFAGPLFGLAPDGVFHASWLAPGAVGSYPAFSPLPAFAGPAVCFLWHFPSAGLSAQPPVYIPARREVTRHHALWCSDFPPPLETNRSDSPLFQTLEKDTARGGRRKPRVSMVSMEDE
jgi:hypothetical protein